MISGFMFKVNKSQAPFLNVFNQLYKELCKKRRNFNLEKISIFSFLAFKSDECIEYSLIGRANFFASFVSSFLVLVLEGHAVLILLFEKWCDAQLCLCV